MRALSEEQGAAIRVEVVWNGKAHRVYRNGEELVCLEWIDSAGPRAFGPCEALAARDPGQVTLCGECGFMLARHPAECVYRGTAAQRARGEVAT